MPRRKLRQSNFSNNNNNDNDKLVAQTQQKKDYELQIIELMKLYDDVDPKTIATTQHPFEASGILGDKSLSMIQKAITCCMRHNGGSATDDEIVAFMRKFWSIISESLEHQHRNPPDRRVVHINFSINKEGKPLFKKVDQTHWAPNDPGSTYTKRSAERYDKTDNSHVVAKDLDGFQERVANIVKESPIPLSFDAILSASEDFKDLPGMFDELPLRSRVRAVLTAKKAACELDFDTDTQLWSKIGTASSIARRTRAEDTMPREIRGLKLKELTINDLWSILKEKGIY